MKCLLAFVLPSPIIRTLYTLVPQTSNLPKTIKHIQHKSLSVSKLKKPPISIILKPIETRIQNHNLHTYTKYREDEKIKEPSRKQSESDIICKRSILVRNLGHILGPPKYVDVKVEDVSDNQGQYFHILKAICYTSKHLQLHSCLSSILGVANEYVYIFSLTKTVYQKNSLTRVICPNITRQMKPQIQTSC